LEPLLPPSTAATMKTIATTTSPAIALSAAGIGSRRRFGFACFGGFGFSGLGGAGSGSGRSSASSGFSGGTGAGDSVAGTSALIGRSALTAATLHGRRRLDGPCWLAGRLKLPATG
jgi:hypothetical protein